MKPCNNCPFRTDVTPYLRPERAEEIAYVLRSGGQFSCHKGLDLPERKRQFCRGALGVMENDFGADANQMVRISMRLGLLAPEVPELAAEFVDASLDEWVERHEAADGAEAPQ